MMEFPPQERGTRPGVLYLVATPIGNLGDMTYRAVQTLKEVDFIACEDTRHSQILLAHYGIKKPLVSFFDHSEKRKTPLILQRIQSGERGALVSDAGTPGVADPGYRLIASALALGIPVETLPGPSAFLSALVLSGLPMHRFAFEGFFPVKSGAKKRLLETFKGQDRTVIFYESPHRLLKTLEAISETLGDISLVVARELTKKFEEICRGRASEMVEKFSKQRIRGEFVILFNLGEQP